MRYRVLLNSGAAKIYLQQTAEELELANLLEGFIGGLIFSENSIMRRLHVKSPMMEKILNRARGLHNAKLIHVSILGEIFWQFAIFLQNSTQKKQFCSYFFWLSSKFFSMTAIRILKSKSPTENRIYHVRSGFGGKSINTARIRGYRIVVDHSIAHPNFLSKVSKNSTSAKESKYSIENVIRQDLENADLVLVNSQFVYETFVAASFKGAMGIAIPPIEAEFAHLLKETNTKRDGIVFVGRCEYRKGIDRILEIVREIDQSIKVTIVGNWDSDSSTIKQDFEKLPNIHLIPFVSRSEVAKILTRSKIFLFPSRAEGAARVVGEALHAGCAVITSRESGVPIPEHAGMVINGRSISEIVETIEKYLSVDTNFDIVSETSRNFIVDLESEYLENLFSLYQDVLRNEI